MAKRSYGKDKGGKRRSRGDTTIHSANSRRVTPEPSTNGTVNLGGDVAEIDILDELPEPPGSKVYYGLAGDMVKAIESTSEADPVAILVQLLVAFGNVIGRTAHWQVEADKHFCNLFAVLVGETGKARKGTSWGRAKIAFESVDSEWTEKRIISGLSSGEGLIWQVRDPIMSRDKIKERGKVVGTQEYESDPGESDKRLMVQEPEFAVVLRRTEQSGNTLSAIIRQAWESGRLNTAVKNQPAKATDAHISLVGHITSEELRRYLTTTEAASGFANRFLWFAVKRSKLLPHGGEPPDLQNYIVHLAEAFQKAYGTTIIKRDEGAKKLWEKVYPQLSEGKPGLVGALIARGEAQVMRLAAIYALLDLEDKINVDHLDAALELWRYSERSVRFIFGDSTGDPVADEILAEIKRSGNKGITRTEIRDLFGRNRNKDRVERSLALLFNAKLVHAIRENNTGGRPAERWFYGNGTTTKTTKTTKDAT